MSQITFANLSGLLYTQSQLSDLVKADILVNPDNYCRNPDGSVNTANLTQWMDGCSWGDFHLEAHPDAMGVFKWWLVCTASTCGVGDCKRIAYELQVDSGSGTFFRILSPGGGGTGVGTTSTCTGHNCASCVFTYTNGVATGCDCAKSGTGTGTATCDHSISQTA